jgi:phenylacetate-coenzyme A ligase PaaK-like adenylate-forming protein
VDHIDRMVLQFRDVLAQTEKLSGRALKAYQDKLLVPLLRHARAQAPFYRERLDPVFRGEEVDLTQWDKIPVFTREDAQRNTQALTARELPAHAGPVQAEETSGSTGRPFEHLRNELQGVANTAMTDRTFRWWGLDGDKAMASFTSRRKQFAPPPDGTTVIGWRVGYRGWYHVIDMWADTDVQIEWLRARKPDYLTAYSSTLLALAERVRQKGVELRFEKIISNATAISDEIRDACEQVLGARPLDHYGAQEAGSLAAECPHCGQYHINAEAQLVEILREDGSACAPGETGRVIVTAFYNYAMPFIRYEVGDYAVAGPARVKCRIKLPTLSRILGRYRNTFTLTDGRIIYPYVAIGRFRDFISFEQVQVVQTDYDAIEVRYVPIDDRPADQAGLEAYLREAIDPSFRVRVVAIDEIPRSASGKFEDFLSLVPRLPR